jgi:hypothetical protein
MKKISFLFISFVLIMFGANAQTGTFKYEVRLPDGKYADISTMGGGIPSIEGKVKLAPSTATDFIFQEMKIQFTFHGFQSEQVNIAIDGRGKNAFPMSFGLGAEAKATVSGFSFDFFGSGRPVPVTSTPVYAGNSNTGTLTIESFDKQKLVVSGYFQFTCKTASSTENIKGNFKNIKLRDTQW